LINNNYYQFNLIVLTSVYANTFLLWFTIFIYFSRRTSKKYLFLISIAYFRFRSDFYERKTMATIRFGVATRSSSSCRFLRVLPCAYVYNNIIILKGEYFLTTKTLAGQNWISLILKYFICIFMFCANAVSI